MVVDPLDRETAFAYDLVHQLEKVAYADPDKVPGG